MDACSSADVSERPQQWLGAGGRVEVPGSDLVLDGVPVYVTEAKHRPGLRPAIEAAIDLARPCFVSGENECASHCSSPSFRPRGYGSLTIEQRQQMLLWLAKSPIDAPLHRNIYWVYLYGLEYRCFVDLNLPDAEDGEINEVLNAIDWAQASMPDGVCRQAYEELKQTVLIVRGRIDKVDGYGGDCNPFRTLRGKRSLSLCKKTYLGQPIDEDEAAMLAASSVCGESSVIRLMDTPDYSRRFLLLARHLYRHQFPDGFVPQARNTGMTISYKILTPALKGCVQLPVPGTREFDVGQNALKPMKALGLRTIGLLKRSALAAKNGVSVELPDLLLPFPLWPDPSRAVFQAWIDEAGRNGGTVLTVERLQKALGVDHTVILPLLDAESSVLHGSGFHFLYHRGRPRTWYDRGTPFVLHPHAPYPTESGMRWIRVLAVALWMEEEPTPGRLKAFDECVERIVRAGTGGDARIARAFQLLYRSIPVRRQVIALELKLRDEKDATPVKQRIALWEMALSILSADGLERANMELASRLASSMHIGDALHERGILQRTRRKPVSDPESRKPRGRPRKAVPAKEPDCPVEPVDITLDFDRVAQLRASTDQASQMLSEIFSEDLVAVQSVQAEGLEPDYLRLLASLVQQDSWSREAIENLCAQRNLMMEGVLERLNDDAWERFGQPLIEGEGPYDINQSICKEYAA